MSLGSAMAEWQAYEAAKIQAATFGHLAPRPRTTYPGEILFTFGEYGDLTLIRVSFDNLPDSPWLMEDMLDFIGDKSVKHKIKEGNVYKFTGTYTKFKNGKCRFSGKTKLVKI